MSRATTVGYNVCLTGELAILNKEVQDLGREKVSIMQECSILGRERSEINRHYALIREGYTQGYSDDSPGTANAQRQLQNDIENLIESREAALASLEYEEERYNTLEAELDMLMTETEARRDAVQAMLESGEKIGKDETKRGFNYASS